MPRHASMAEQLAPMRQILNQPEHIEPLQTNWSTVAANDNNPEDMIDMRPERRLRIRPTEPAMDAEIAGEIVRGETVRGETVWSEHFQRYVPGPIVAIGDLRFSDGTQTEKAFTYGPDGRLIQYDARMPLGAMLGTQEKQERMLGGDAGGSDLSATSSRIVKWLGAKRSRSRPKFKRDRSKDKNYTRAESLAILEEAWRNTDPAKVRVTVADKGMPWRPSNATELFLSMMKTTKGESGSVSWQDISGHIVDREENARATEKLKTETKATLEALKTASSMADIGKAHGKRGRQAWTVGKAKLLAANDDIMTTVRKMAA